MLTVGTITLRLRCRLKDERPRMQTIERREADTRRKITSLLHCDLKRDQPLHNEQQYSVVTSFYCAENIGITHDEWFRVLRRLANLTAPGGYLFLSALRETHFYVVESADGRRQRLPSAYLTEQHFRDVLPAARIRHPSDGPGIRVTRRSGRSRGKRRDPGRRPEGLNWSRCRPSVYCFPSQKQ